MNDVCLRLISYILAHVLPPTIIGNPLPFMTSYVDGPPELRQRGQGGREQQAASPTAAAGAIELQEALQAYLPETVVVTRRCCRVRFSSQHSGFASSVIAPWTPIF